MPRNSWMRRVFNLKSPSVYWHAESELILVTFLLVQKQGVLCLNRFLCGLRFFVLRLVKNLPRLIF